MKTYKILIADDEPHIRRILKFNLESAGFSVVAVANGKDAIKKAKDEKPDLVILDVLMPEATGYEVSTALRADKTLCEIPIIILSAKGEEAENIEQAKVNRIDLCLSKPFSPSLLVEKVKQILKL